MEYQLTVVSGRHKGQSFPLLDTDIVIGRHPDCNLFIPDPMVSRKHCRILVQDGEIHLKDLGSRNPTLVNGLPCTDGVLHLGDEISVGSWVLLLNSAAGKTRQGSEGPDSDTMSHFDSPSSALSLADARDSLEPRPRTFHDLIFLYDCSTDFSAAETVHALLRALLQRVTERFRPKRFWAAQVRDDELLTFLPFEEMPTESPPPDIIRLALRERRGQLSMSTLTQQGHRVLSFVMVAPAQSAGVTSAVLIVQAETPHPAYTEDDLRLLMLLSKSFMPFLGAVEEVEQLRRDYERLRTRAGESLVLVGNSNSMRLVRERIAGAAQSGLNALITGESGTGKEMAARLLHAQSVRQSGPFIPVNCAAIPRELFESEFFGFEKGAFTGAGAAREGYFAMAHGGTLFLDEIGDLSLDNQARLLRAIEYGTFRRIGGKDETRVDVRVVAATNTDIPEAIRKGLFREDLYQRLRGFEVHMPPLRERPADIPVYANYFFEMAKTQGRTPLAGFTQDALDLLCAQRWRGNVRELRYSILRAVSIANGPEITAKDLVDASLAAREILDAELLSIDDAEKKHISGVLQHFQGNVNQAAKVLGVGRSTLYRKISEFGIAE